MRWSIPLELMDCIAGYEYSFQYSSISGLVPANTTMLLLVSVLAHSHNCRLPDIHTNVFITEIAHLIVMEFIPARVLQICISEILLHLTRT